MDDITCSGERDGRPKYDPSIGIIGWLVGALVVWAVVLIPWLALP